MQHFEHAVALAGAEVAGKEAAVLGELPERGDVAAGEVDDVDVVAHAGAVVGGIVVAVDVQLLKLADGHLGYVGHQVVGDAARILADESALVRADGVEVAQQRDVHRRVGGAVVHEYALLKELCGAVGVCGAAGGEVLAYRHALGVAVDRGGGGEDKVLHVVAAHGLEHLEGAGEVVVVVLQRLGDALAHCLEPGKVDDGVNISKALEQLLHLVGVSQLGLDEGDALADNVLHAVDGFLAGIAEVVGDNDVIARLDELNAGMAADVPGAAGNENGHENRSFNSI